MAGELDEQAFIRALHEGDSEKVFNLLQDAIEIDIQGRAEEERERTLEIEAQAREQLEIEEAKREWRMR
jgi:hypothetical protein